MKLWPTRNSLRECLEKGPLDCLRLRMQNYTSIQLHSDDDSSLNSFEGTPPVLSLKSAVSGSPNNSRGNSPSRASRPTSPSANPSHRRRSSQGQRSSADRRTSANPSRPRRTSSRASKRSRLRLNSMVLRWMARRGQVEDEAENPSTAPSRVPKIEVVNGANRQAEDGVNARYSGCVAMIMPTLGTIITDELLLCHVCSASSSSHSRGLSAITATEKVLRRTG